MQDKSLREHNNLLSKKVMTFLFYNSSFSLCNLVFKNLTVHNNNGLSEKQIKDKEKELAPQEQDGLQNNMDVTSVLVTQPPESLTIGLVSFRLCITEMLQTLFIECVWVYAWIHFCLSFCATLCIYQLPSQMHETN